MRFLGRVLPRLRKHVLPLQERMLDLWILARSKEQGWIWAPWMTGSAGTAMDVLVTCFSKMGGGSGRRGCKY